MSYSIRWKAMISDLFPTRPYTITTLEAQLSGMFDYL